MVTFTVGLTFQQCKHILLYLNVRCIIGLVHFQCTLYVQLVFSMYVQETMYSLLKDRRINLKKFPIEALTSPLSS